MKISKIALAVSALVISGGAFAHGFITEPASRDQLCSSGGGNKNINCGDVQYEPQSVGETDDGFPELGPKDGQLVSGGNTRFSAVDAQSSDRWYKHDVQPGPLTISWHFTAQHPIKDFKYYLTKQDWNPNLPLTRDSFELTPFCVIPGGPIQGENISHTCNLPERTGYQVIYGAWDVSDTGATFYKAIDVQFDEIASEWKHNIGAITPTQTLEAGDSVKARLFDANGERDDLSVTLNIDSAEAGEPNLWSMALATKINAAHDTIRAGVKNKEGDVVPVAGANTIFAKEGSAIVRVELQVNAQADTRPGLTLSNMQDRYTIAAEGKTSVPVDVKVVGEMVLNAKAYNAKQENVGFGSVVVEDQTVTLPIEFWKAEEGAHSIVVEGRMRDGKTFQQSFETRLESAKAVDYDFVYPEGIAQYVEGTKVLQPQNNEVYECKPFPASGWCKINAHHYVPGIGSNWQDAWTQISGHKH
ncbi:N-acetylglucosamine-binding protein GbpA [Enterobacterales bacterium CwR94]|nr:N-acetylglucosamine-binding protein GbpA [Enterobacterales bacterium CwR94]